MDLSQPVSSLENGIYAAALTPLNLDLSCHHQELAYHCKDLINRGCKGVVLFGTTGEGASFSVKERLLALKDVLTAGISSHHLIMGSGASNLPELVELALASLNLGVNTLLVAPPSFFKNVPEAGVIAFYRELIQRVNNSKLRLILYHIPQFTGVPITLKIIEHLRFLFPQILTGIKESEGNLNFTHEILKTFPDFKVFVGNEKQIAEAVHHGAAGAICGLANLFPELICSLYEQGKHGKHGKQGSFEIPQNLELFFEANKTHSFIAAFKALMEARRGEIWRWLRPPLLPLNKHDKEALMSQVSHLNLNKEILRN